MADKTVYLNEEEFAKMVTKYAVLPRNNKSKDPVYKPTESIILHENSGTTEYKLKKQINNEEKTNG